jgi:hypothetical protein
MFVYLTLCINICLGVRGNERKEIFEKIWIRIHLRCGVNNPYGDQTEKKVNRYHCKWITDKNI